MIRRIIVLGDSNFIFNELPLENINMKGETKRVPHFDLPNVLWGENRIQESFRDNNFSMKRTSRAYVSEVERQEILKALHATRWNRKMAAELLQVSYKTLLNRISEFNLTP